MEHNKLCRANAGRNNRLPRLVTQVESAFFSQHGFIHVPKETFTCHILFAQDGHIWFAQLLLENFSSTLASPGNYPLLLHIYTNRMRISNGLLDRAHRKIKVSC